MAEVPNYVENLIVHAPRESRFMQDGNLRYENFDTVKKSQHDESDIGPISVTDFVDGSSFLDRLSPNHHETVSALDRLFDDQESIQVDPTLTQHPIRLPSLSSSPVPTKRKATSRANMLSRGGACEFCKRRKLKCTAEVPSCTACSRAGRDCVYSQIKQRSRVRVLEDRLVELEKRLDPPNGTVELDNRQEAHISPPTTTDDLMPLAGVDNETSDFERYYGITLGAGFTLPSLDNISLDNRLEPDLMTLADAAASDTRQSDTNGWPWEGMSTEAIASEIVKAVEGGKGVGEKIVGHL